MVADSEFHVRPIDLLIDVITSPQDPICPGRSSCLLARVPVVGAWIEFVGGRKRQLALGVTREDLPSETLARIVM
jgi:hypothetical protein